MTEEYGIRYAIRSSGQHAIMIAVNPLPVHATVPFNTALANSVQMNSSAHVEVLFETGADNPLTYFNGAYKTTRNGRVTLPSFASTRQLNYSSGKTFTDTFAPLDVHIYRL